MTDYIMILYVNISKQIETLYIDSGSYYCNFLSCYRTVFYYMPILPILQFFYIFNN